MLKIGFTKTSPCAVTPSKAYNGDAGWDLYSSQDVVIPAGQSVDVEIGIAIELPVGAWCHILPRSSTLRKHKLNVISAVIDCGYRGQLFVMAQNIGSHDVVIKHGHRLAQLILHQVWPAEWEEKDELSPSERGSNGFGSTGA